MDDNRTSRTGDIFLRTADGFENLGYLLVASGYLVVRSRVLLVHHNAFDKWVPPGGHIVPGETFSEAAVRECLEETGLVVSAISATAILHPADDNATPEPTPFYVDILREGFRRPCLTQYFFLDLVDRTKEPTLIPEADEVYGARFFGEEELADIPTFDQVRSLCRFALAHHPRRAS
jgi:8-oxo-dGTP pyrophosphatase MutT (NUDIX family)